MEGWVVRGRGLGRTIGVPTANVRIARSRLIPGRGVYACLARAGEAEPYRAVTNIGVRPTVSGHDESVEVHFIDFAGDLYGCRMSLDFIERLREECAFPSLSALGRQIRKDIARANVAIDAFSGHARSPEAVGN